MSNLFLLRYITWHDRGIYSIKSQKACLLAATAQLTSSQISSTTSLTTTSSSQWLSTTARLYSSPPSSLSPRSGPSPSAQHQASPASPIQIKDCLFLGNIDDRHNWTKKERIHKSSSMVNLPTRGKWSGSYKTPKNLIRVLCCVLSLCHNLNQASASSVISHLVHGEGGPVEGVWLVGEKVTGDCGPSDSKLLDKGFYINSIFFKITVKHLKTKQSTISDLAFSFNAILKNCSYFTKKSLSHNFNLGCGSGSTWIRIII